MKFERNAVFKTRRLAGSALKTLTGGEPPGTEQPLGMEGHLPVRLGTPRRASPSVAVIAGANDGAPQSDLEIAGRLANTPENLRDI